MQKHIRKLVRTSTHSFIITLPKEIIKKYAWKEKQKLVVTDLGRGRIVIKDWKNK